MCRAVYSACVSVLVCVCTQVEAGQRVGALPLLLMSRHFDIIHHQRNPTSEHIHPDRQVESERETGTWRETCETRLSKPGGCSSDALTSCVCGVCVWCVCAVLLVVNGGGRVQAAGQGGRSTECRFTPRQRVCDIIRTGTNQKLEQLSLTSCVMNGGDGKSVCSLNYVTNTFTNKTLKPPLTVE